MQCIWCRCMYIVLKKGQPLFQNPEKHIFMNTSTKTYVAGFQIKQWAGNKWESGERRETGLRHSGSELQWLPLVQVGFRSSSQQGHKGPSQPLCLGGSTRHRTQDSCKASPESVPECSCEWSKLLCFHPPTSSPITSSTLMAGWKGAVDKAEKQKGQQLFSILCSQKLQLLTHGFIQKLNPEKVYLGVHCTSLSTFLLKFFITKKGKNVSSSAFWEHVYVTDKIVLRGKKYHCW
jgi:hypothetical protein